MERILRDNIYKHLDKQGLIKNSQHGFVPGRSCLTKLLESFEEVTREIDEGKAVDVVYMDFSKAFDKFPHGRLVKKVQSLVVNGEMDSTVAKWEMSEFNGGWLFVRLEAGDQWVASGSVLGPLLFVMYINDLDDGVENWISKYADDTKVGGVVENEEDSQSLQRDLGYL